VIGVIGVVCVSGVVCVIGVVVIVCHSSILVRGKGRRYDVYDCRSIRGRDRGVTPDLIYSGGTLRGLTGRSALTFETGVAASTAIPLLHNSKSQR
jgi:hypothetical protein